MPAQYITLKQNDREFSEYLWGRGGAALKSNQRAIPVKTSNLGTPEEAVTFELKNISEIKKPGIFLFLSSLVKLNTFVLILFPLYYVLTKNYLAGRIADPLAALLAALSSALLFAGLNIRNDVYDHISGFDRVNLNANCKPIRMGWISAITASRLSLILIFFSGLLALPVILRQPELCGVIAIALGLFFIGRFEKNNSYKQQHLGEFILFMLVGPALVSGYQVAAGAGIDTEVLSFGVLWGVAVVYLVQVNNFSHLMTSSQSGIRNTMTKLGFDRAQKFLIAWWIFFIALWALFHYYYSPAYWALFGTLSLLLCSVPLYLKISNIKSPMGSGLQAVRKAAHKTFLLTVFIFLLENLWSLWAVASAGAT